MSVLEFLYNIEFYSKNPTSCLRKWGWYFRSKPSGDCSGLAFDSTGGQTASNILLQGYIDDRHRQSHDHRHRCEAIPGD